MCRITKRVLYARAGVLRSLMKTSKVMYCSRALPLPRKFYLIRKNDTTLTRRMSCPKDLSSYPADRVGITYTRGCVYTSRVPRERLIVRRPLSDVRRAHRMTSFPKTLSSLFSLIYLTPTTVFLSFSFRPYFSLY